MKRHVRYTGTKAQREAAAFSDACAWLRDNAAPGGLDMLCHHVRTCYAQQGPRVAYRSTLFYLGLAGVEGLPAYAFIRAQIRDAAAIRAASNIAPFVR